MELLKLRQGKRFKRLTSLEGLVFHIRFSTGYEESGGRFKSINRGEIFWINNNNVITLCFWTTRLRVSDC